MPLVVRRRKGTASFWLFGTVEGKRIRESANTTDPKHAEIKRAARETQLFKEAIAGIRPTVPFAVAAASYLKAEAPGLTQRENVAKLTKVLGTTPTREIDQTHADRARDAICGAEVSAATVVRNVVSPLTSILRHASRRQWCDWPRLEWPAIAAQPFHFLTPAQFQRLVDNAAQHVRPLFTFMVCTGVRAGEALTLDWSQVDLAAGRVILWEGSTKTGKRRTIHLNAGALTALANLPGRDGRVFRRDDGEPYDYREGNRNNMKNAWAAAASRAGLPGRKVAGHGTGGQFRPDHTPHDLRHTFATWHYALNKDLLLLKQEVGWGSTQIAERYAHVMPTGHEAGIRAVWGTFLTQRTTDVA